MTSLMKILVPLKRVTDPDTKIRLKPDGTAVDLDGVKFAVNHSTPLRSRRRCGSKSSSAKLKSW
jgi:hypothetical protein